MKRLTTNLTALVGALVLGALLAPADVALARGFGGFHGGGGFGGFHGGGGYGGFHAGGFGGGYGGYHPKYGGFDRGGYSGGFDRNSFGDFDRGNYGGFDRAGSQSFGSGYRAADYGAVSRNSLNSFLSLPTDGGFHAASGYASGDFGAAAGRSAADAHTWTGPEGTTIAHGTAGAQGAAVGPRGAAAGGAIASGTAVKTPSGNVYTHGEAAGRGIATNGATTVAARGVASRTTAAGAWGHYSGTYIHAQGVAANRWVNSAGIWHGGWAATHPWAWRPAAYTAAAWATACWAWADWPALGSWISYNPTPVYYDYGNTITLDDGNVYYGDEPVATQQQYYQEAQNIADQGGADNGDSGDWLPLGVFGLIPPGQKTPTMVFQLAINKQGIIKGNYYDEIADTNVPVHGSLNKTNQRVAWQIGKNKNLVIDTGIYNLTMNDSQALVHNGPDNTEQYTMIRLKQPGDNTPATNEQAATP